MDIDKLSLVIPAFNEEEAIARIVEGAKGALQARISDLEIIVVDDGPEDKTAEKASAAGAKVLRHPTNLGYGNALKTGILASKHGHVAICDADDSYDPRDLNKLLPFAPFFDMVVGMRTGKEFLGKGLKRWARWWQLQLVRFSTGTHVPDANSGMRIFKKSNLLTYFEGLCGGFSFTTSITLAMLSTGRTVKYVPIQYRPRIGKSHIRFFRDTLRSMQILIHAMLKYNPIKAFFSVMILPIVIGLLGLGGHNCSPGRRFFAVGRVVFLDRAFCGILLYPALWNGHAGLCSPEQAPGRARENPGGGDHRERVTTGLPEKATADVSGRMEC